MVITHITGADVIAHFFTELATISPILPFLARTLVVVMAIALVWVVLSVPGFWLCRTLGVFLTSAIAKLADLRRRIFAVGLSLFSRRAQPIEAFVASHAQMFSFSSENSQVRTEIKKVRVAIEAIPSRIASLEARITDAGKNFEAASETLARTELPQPVTAPAAQDFAAVQRGRNRAVITLTLSLILTPAFIAFNTAMLNEFLNGFWPGLEYFGIPLSLVLAGFATLFEIGLGVFLALSVNRLAQLAWYSGIALLAFIEMSFYARLGQGFNWSIFDAFYPNGNAPAWTKMWFGSLGLVLVLCLAGAGHALFTSIAQLADQHVIRQWRRYISARMRHATTMSQKLGDAARAKGLLLSSLQEVQTQFTTTDNSTRSGMLTIENAKQEFLSQVDRAAAIRLEDTRRLDRGAMLRQFIECLVFAVTIIFALALIAMVYGTLVLVSPSLWLSGWWLGWGVALGEAVLLFGAGSAVSRANVTLPATDGIPATNLAQSRMGPILGFVMLIAVLVGNGFFVLRGLGATSMMLFLLVTAADAFLFWCGTRLGMIGAAVWSVLVSAGTVMASAVVWVSGLLVGAIGLACAAARVVLVVLAYPYSILFLRDPTGSQLVSARAAA